MAEKPNNADTAVTEQPAKTPDELRLELAETQAELAQARLDLQKKTNRFNAFRTWQVVAALLTWVVLTGVLFWIMTEAIDSFDSNAANSLTASLVIGTVALLLSVAALLIIFARLSLTNWKQPLGLPQGSVRAIIALLLILLFFISAIFFYTDLSQTSTRTIKGLTAAQVAELDVIDIVQVMPQGDTADAPVDVEVIDGRSEASEELAKQMMTTVSTLVVAIAAFYFGAKSVESAKSEQPSSRPTDELTPEELAAKEAAAKKAAAAKREAAATAAAAANRSGAESKPPADGEPAGGAASDADR